MKYKTNKYSSKLNQILIPQFIQIFFLLELHQNSQINPKLLMHRRVQKQAKCQRCLEPGHWSYECQNPPAYVYRPTARAIYLNPELKKPTHLAGESDESDNSSHQSVQKPSPGQASPDSKPRARSRSRSSSPSPAPASKHSENSEASSSQTSSPSPSPIKPSHSNKPKN